MVTFGGFSGQRFERYDFAQKARSQRRWCEPATDNGFVVQWIPTIYVFYVHLNIYIYVYKYIYKYKYILRTNNSEIRNVLSLQEDSTENLYKSKSMFFYMSIYCQ